MIEQYLAEKSLVWTESTLRTETSRLTRAQKDDLLDATPLEALKKLREAGRGQYTTKTLFVRIANYFDWLVEKGVAADNPWAEFLKKNGQVFRHAYKKETVEETFEGAREKIESIGSKLIRDHALFLLHSGLRISESYNVKPGQKHIDGKGGRRRPLFAEPPKETCKPHILRAALSEHGLKPHTLRKLLATKLVNQDMRPQELCRVFGWSDINTAMSYLQPRSDEQLREAIQSR